MSPRPTPPTPAPAPPAPCVLTSSSQITPTRGGWLVDGTPRPSLSGCRVDLRAGEELRITLHTAEERAPTPVAPAEPAERANTEPAAQVLVTPPPPGVLVSPPPPARGLGGAGAVLLALGLAYLRYGRPRGRERDRDRAEPCTLAPRVEALERRLEALEREARERAPCPARELLERVGA
jgi:hypothetical protein